MIIARTFYYLYISKLINRPYIPYSARAPYVDAISKIGAEIPINARSIVLEYIQNETRPALEEINDFFLRILLEWISHQSILFLRKK